MYFSNVQKWKIKNQIIGVRSTTTLYVNTMFKKVK